ncbi:MAG: hypothetical protein OHK006_16650 [Thermodesulfovibrionales bacterium]
MFRVLKTRRENEEARAALRRRGLDCLATGIFDRLLRAVGMRRTVQVGDPVKSWDLFATVEFIEQNMPRTSRVLDLGAYASEVLCVLHRLGYRRLSGIDLNPSISQMPHSGSIRYVEGDIMRTPFPENSFDAVTAVSVIEHGFQEEKLLQELARIVAPGGYFIASVDYWPQKIDTAGLHVFGLDWLIFSEQDMRRFLARAVAYGFSAIGSLDFGADERVVSWNGKDYTFAWFVLRKAA